MIKDLLAQVDEYYQGRKDVTEFESEIEDTFVRLIAKTKNGHVRAAYAKSNLAQMNKRDLIYEFNKRIHSIL